MAKLPFSAKDTVPVLPAKVVIALPVLVKVKVAAVPKSSRPAAAISAPLSWVTDPVVYRVKLLAPTETAPVNCIPLLDAP